MKWLGFKKLFWIVKKLSHLFLMTFYTVYIYFLNSSELQLIIFDIFIFTYKL